MLSRTFPAAASLVASIALVVLLSPPRANAEPAAPAAAAEPSEPQAVELVKKVQAFYDKARTFQARFDQRYKIRAYDTVKTNSGQVLFQKPGKMSWDYENGNRVVSDGQTLHVYEKDKKQVYRQNIKKSPYPAALSFLGGNGDLGKEFSFKLLDSAKMKFPGGQVLLGTPREATPAYQKLLLYVDTQTSQVRRVLLIDAQQNTNRFDFEQVKVNQTVADKHFYFTAPAGTNLITP
jgi:outer membrane lipoprotein carrier protein